MDLITVFRLSPAFFRYMSVWVCVCVCMCVYIHAYICYTRFKLKSNFDRFLDSILFSILEIFELIWLTKFIFSKSLTSKILIYVNLTNH